MTDTELLRQKISDSGLKLEYVAERLGITRQSLCNKIENRSTFNQKEIGTLCKILGIKSYKDINLIFFDSL